MSKFMLGYVAKNMDSLFKDSVKLRSSVNQMAEDVSLLDDKSKKAIGELDTLYEIDHRTQKQLTEIEMGIEEIKRVLERDDTDSVSRIDLKLE